MKKDSGYKTEHKNGILERFMPYERQIRAFFQRRLRNMPDSEDLTQEVFLRVLKLAEEEEIKNPRAFLFTIARNLILNHSAKKSRSIVDALEDLSSSQNINSETSTENDVLAREEWRIFSEAVAQLPSQCRKVFVLKKVYGFSNKEIAMNLKISTSTVEKHIAAGLRRVRATLMGDKNRAENGLNKISVVTELKRDGLKRNELKSK